MSRMLVHTAMAVMLLAPAAFAHHPFGDEFDRNKPVTVTGTVTEFEWRNPHAGIHVEGKDASGNSGEWMVELGGMADLTKSGWSRTSLKPGDMVTIQGWMAKDGSKHVNARQVTTSAGAKLMAASSMDASASSRPGETVGPAVEVAGTAGTP